MFPSLSCTTQLFVSFRPLFAKKNSHLNFIPVVITSFKAVPIASYRRTSNLSDFLFRAKLRNLTHHNQPRGSYLRGKNCFTYKYCISGGQTSYKFHSTDETRLTTHHNNCNSRNVIYMVQCNSFLQQYIGQTKRRLKDRFNEHRSQQPI